MIWIWSLLATVSAAVTVDDIVGTWTTKSQQVLTGPGFYDPLNDRLIEPDLTGISYSFDADGNYEEAFYRALANREWIRSMIYTELTDEATDPECPSGIMQWQHGSYKLSANGSLALHPIAVDGRQLLSEPCRQDFGAYTRYNNTEHFKEISVSIDKYHRAQRLDLIKSNGEKIQPMYLAYRPPKMLPTHTLNPVPTSKKKRDLSGAGIHQAIREELINPDRWWWFGVMMTSLGGIAFFFS
ncbi:uncharacterized protein N7498_002983 [Penicillium cinerascens]|uniref:Protein ROT1 n=1 Tax=Penicillium cinerascens TaxID=70096 RepID=A0A9W9TBM1_9EURO|nr:uncharacterized protein N7498_002983 [Penicillium cinerascens]KAJ5216576.1 hypothetical protein N7498_002983 [Penicillium cinerascens]